MLSFCGKKSSGQARTAASKARQRQMWKTLKHHVFSENTYIHTNYVKQRTCMMYYKMLSQLVFTAHCKQNQKRICAYTLYINIYLDLK